MLRQLTEWLQSEGVGTLGVDLFRNELPPAPVRAMAVILYDGVEPPGTHDSDYPAYEDSRVQVMTRGASYAEAQAYARSAYDALYRLRNTLVDGCWFLRAAPLQLPFNEGEDAGGNNLVLFNSIVWSNDHDV